VKHKTTFKIFSLFLSMLLLFSAPSCSKNDKQDNSIPEEPEIDYLSLDLSQYVTLGQYKGLEITITPKPSVTEEEVISKIRSDLIYNGYTEKVTDRAVTKDDTVSISFVGYRDGVAFEGGTGSKDNFTVYDGGGFIDGFAEGIIGAMPGVEVDVNVTFPEVYHSEELAGKDAVFKVTVKHIYEAKELTDKIAKSLSGGSHTTVEALIEYYTERLIKEKDKAYEEKKSALAWDKIFSGISNVNIPDEMVNAQYDYDIFMAQSYADIYGVDLDTYLSGSGYTRESLRDQIKNDILTNMVIYSIMKNESVTLTEEDYDSFIKDSGYTEEQWLSQYTKEELEEMFLYTKTYNEAVKWQRFIEKELDIK